VLPKTIEHWSLTSLQQRVNMGGEFVRYTQYYWLLPGGKASDATCVQRDFAEYLGAGLAGRV
jgi:hypothetical protein